MAEYISISFGLYFKYKNTVNIAEKYIFSSQSYICTAISNVEIYVPHGTIRLHFFNWTSIDYTE